MVGFMLLLQQQDLFLLFRAQLRFLSKQKSQLQNYITYKTAEVVLGGDFFEDALVKEAEDFPALYKLH